MERSQPPKQPAAESDTVMPIEAFDVVGGSLIGLPISYVWRGYGSALFIEFGELRPKFKRDGSIGHPQGEVSLGVEWSWRIEDRSAIRCGSWSEEELWEPAFDLLRNVRVAQCELFGTLPEIMIGTVDGIRFLSFSTTDGQPQWNLVDRRDGPARWTGTMVLGQRGETASWQR